MPRRGISVRRLMGIVACSALALGGVLSVARFVTCGRSIAAYEMIARSCVANVEEAEAVLARYRREEAEGRDDPARAEDAQGRIRVWEARAASRRRLLRWTLDQAARFRSVRRRPWLALPVETLPPSS